MCINGAWMRICNDYSWYYYYYRWDTANTNVVCRQLGYTLFGNYYIYFMLL